MKSIKELRKICQKEDSEPFMDRLWRPFSIWATRFFIAIGLTPNFATLLGLFSGILGGYLFVNGKFVSGSILFALAYLFDNVDGEIARYRKMGSKFGAWLDTAVSHFLYPYFWLILGVGIYLSEGSSVYIILGAIAAVAKLLQRSVPQTKGITDNENFLSKHDFTVKADFYGNAKEWLNQLTRSSVVYLVMVIASVLGLETGFLWFFTFYLAVFALAKFFLTGWRIYIYEKINNKK